MFFPLEVYAASGLVNFITSTFLGVFILIKTHRSKTNRLFAYFCFSVSLWSFFYCLWLSTPNKFLAEYYLRTLMIPAFFMPIFFNAIDAMPDGGRLTVSSSITGTSHFVITIEDTGSGIPKEYLKHIFEPFYSQKKAIQV